MKNYLAEFIGTFALVFCGTGAIVVGQELGAPGHLGICITFGLVVTAMVYSFGHISGAHINPAVSIAFSIAGVFPRREVVPYILSQLSAAALASALLWWMFPQNELYGATHPSGSVIQSLVLEIVITFILMAVILFTAFGNVNTRHFAGVAIGMAVMLLALFAGPVCGASMNPARSFGPALVSGEWGDFWIYVLAPVVGAGLAVPVWKYVGEA